MTLQLRAQRWTVNSWIDLFVLALNTARVICLNCTKYCEEHLWPHSHFVSDMRKTYWFGCRKVYHKWKNRWTFLVQFAHLDLSNQNICCCWFGCIVYVCWKMLAMRKPCDKTRVLFDGENIELDESAKTSAAHEFASRQSAHAYSVRMALKKVVVRLKGGVWRPLSLQPFLSTGAHVVGGDQRSRSSSELQTHLQSDAENEQQELWTQQCCNVQLLDYFPSLKWPTRSCIQIQASISLWLGPGISLNGAIWNQAALTVRLSSRLEITRMKVHLLALRAPLKLTITSGQFTVQWCQFLAVKAI